MVDGVRRVQGVERGQQMTTEERLQKEYKTYCCKMSTIIDHHATYKVMGYKQWKENREQIERREGIEDK